MIKRISFIIVLLSSLIGKSQDSLFFRDGNVKPSKIIEVTNLRVKYKKYNDKGNRTVLVYTSALDSIKYESGEVKRFQDNSSLIQAKIDSIEFVLSSKSISPKNQEEKKETIKVNPVLEEGKWSVGFNTYIISPGALVSHTLIKNKLYANAGGNYLKLNIPNSVFDNFDIADTITVNGSGSLGRYYLGMDYRVIGLLLITGGLQYNDFKFTTNVGLTKDHIEILKKEEYGVNGIATIPKELINDITIVTKANSIAPFLGLVIGNTVPKRKVGFRFEIGTVFQGKMVSTAESKIIDFGLEDPKNPGTILKRDIVEEDIFKDAITKSNEQLESLSVLPYFSLGINFKIK